MNLYHSCLLGCLVSGHNVRQKFNTSKHRGRVVSQPYATGKLVANPQVHAAGNPHHYFKYAKLFHLQLSLLLLLATEMD